MEIEPPRNGEKYVSTSRGPMDLISEYRIINRVNAAYFSQHYRNLFVIPNELLIHQLEGDWKDDV